MITNTTNAGPCHCCGRQGDTATPTIRSAADVDLGERVESVRQCVSAHLDNLAAHEAWCYAKGRCTYCDPLHDVLAILNGESATKGE